MNKLLHFILTPLIAVLLVVLKIPEAEEEIGSWYENAHVYIIGLLVVATIYNYYITVLSPYKTLQASKKKRWERLDQEAEKIIQAFNTSSSFDLSFNIMIPHRKLLSRYEPGTNSVFPKVFKVVWSCGTHHVNSHLKFTTNQGACGKSYRDEDFCVFDLQKMRTENADLAKTFNFTAEQVRLTEKVIMVASCPIILKENEPDAQRREIIGVLNVECHMNNSGVFASDPAKREALYVNMKILTNIYATF